MQSEDDRLIFAALLHEEIERCSSTDADPLFREEQFARYMIDALASADQVEDGSLSYYSKGSLKVNAYHFNETEDCLDLFVCSPYSGSDPAPNFSKPEVDAILAKARRFFEASLKGLAQKIEETSDASDLAFQIPQMQKRKLLHVRFIAFIDGFTRLIGRDRENVGPFTYSYHVFDLAELQRYKESGTTREPININFKDAFGESIRCLPVIECETDFDACIALIPGELLCRIYDVHGAGLLERNIRSFLRATGKVNRKIKNTIMETPGRFLAYNNGISCTASAIEFDVIDKREWRIKQLNDFQIVNGGQTTASLYNAYKRYKADLSKVYVQAKISIIKNPAMLDETVSKISLYANSQNKVSESDFYALDSFHVAIEKLSRTTLASPEVGKPRMSKWFYERARGAYLDDRSRAKKVAAFDEEYPKSRVFTKTDLALYESVWSELPHMACLGEQKNFSAFTIRVGKEKITVDEKYFKEAVAKCLLYRAAEAMVKKHKLPAYKAQIAKYSLAFVLNRSRTRLELSEIWKRQSVPTWLVDALDKVVPVVHQRLSESYAGKNVTEWCKKEHCWETIRALSIDWNR